ncbi:hypothetical protein PG991_001818 [Apiospora marii]|uniref:Uncharacterized protein n=1 Tax=Apiospora marii TaxID=335849 RepID=A0ABR1SN63_9PEZI
MSELQNIWDDLERSKANKNRNGKWGFTIYRTDYEDQRLWREYVRYLRSTIESTVDPDKDKPIVDPLENTVEDQKTKSERKFRKRIRANFELVVVEDRLLDGCTTAQVRQYHRQRIKTYLDGQTFRSSAPHQNGNDKPAEEGNADNQPAENATVKKEMCTPPNPSLPTPAKEPDEEEDHENDEENHAEESHAGKNHEGEQSKPKRKRPPREEKRVGHVWQDYFLHANADVLKKYGHACRQEQQLSKWPSIFSYHFHHDEAPHVAIVAEAERSDYRLRRFGLWAGDGSVPELGMAWQYVEVAALPGLYDRLGRRPLGRAQLLAEGAGAGAATCGHHGGGGTGVCVPGVVVREPLYGRAFAAIGAEDHGPWYEGFCFPPAVNRM